MKKGIIILMLLLIIPYVYSATYNNLDLYLDFDIGNNLTNLATGNYNFEAINNPRHNLTSYKLGSGSYTFLGGSGTNSALRNATYPMGNMRTINLWLKSTLIEQDRWFFSACQNNQNFMVIGYETGGTIQAELRSSATIRHHLNSTEPIQNDTWYMVTYVLNESINTTKLYIDGELVDNNSNTTGPAAGWNIEIGAIDCVSANDHKGEIDEFSIWNITLNSTEISQIYNSGDGIKFYQDNVTINITFREASDQSIITKNISTEYIGTYDYGLFYNSSGGHEFKYTFPTFDDTTTDVVSFRVRDTTGDYSIVTREVEINRNIDQTNITIYLTNTSDLTTTKTVTFHTVDEDLANLEGAIVHILRQDTTTGSFLPITDLTTNSNGEATTILELDTVFYRWTVEYEGNIVFSLSSPVPITSNDDTIELVCIVGDPYSDYWETIFNTNVQTTYVPTNNVSGGFTSTWSGSSNVEVCQNVTIINSTGTFQQDYDCLNATSGSVSSATFTSTNRTLYCANSKIDFKDGGGFRYADGLCYMIGGQNVDIFGGEQKESLLLLLVPVVFGAFGFVSLSVVGPLMMALSYIAIFLTGWTFLTIQALIIIICFCILSMFTIVRIKK